MADGSGIDRTIGLDDRFDLTRQRVLASGTQALIRLVLMQKERDRRAGLNTAGYITGYRGSPLGGLDQQFGRAKARLEAETILFKPAINEDLAATALWGTQQAQMRGTGKQDGVFGIWYGKGPGVDRTGDAFKHANLAGTSPHGGVIALMGDDHTCESSTTAHQSEFAFVDAMMPVLNPAGVQEILDYGLHGFALSRFASVWVGLKCVKDTIESTATVDGALDRVKPVLPEIERPDDGLSIRPADPPLAQEERLHRYKLPAVLAYLRANRLDRVIVDGGAAPRLGIVTTGKSTLDVLEALDHLGLSDDRARALGLTVYKVGCSWPLEPEGAREFATGLELVVVVEEKRGLVEPQLKDALYGTAGAPAIVGKRDEAGAMLFASHGALDAVDIAVALGERVVRLTGDAQVAERVEALRQAAAAARARAPIATRIPYFCPGCPHNTSTKVPTGHKAYAGIGCHYMAQWMDRDTEGYTQMGAEGANWVGEAAFSTLDHVFQNIGDGTYNHSGLLAIRAAAAAGVNVTYKVLYNDAVAMTGGQKHDGDLTVPMIAAQVVAEGAKRLAIVSDEPTKYPSGTAWPPFTTFHHRDELDAVQRELATVKGLSVLIYDQTCAAEKRRRRKRGAFPDPNKRVLINDLVCEGCGDCGVQSNCVAIEPLETELGRKRRIDQSACNKDFSCQKGFCPSFVTVHGAKPKAGTARAAPVEAVPEPARMALDRNVSIIVTGVGGTGVVTIGQILAMAAPLDGAAAGLIDMAGLAQKGGAVASHIRLAPTSADIATIRVAAGGADVVIGGDLVTTGGPKTLGLMATDKTTVIVNTHETITGDFTRDIDFSLPTERLIRAIRSAAGAARTHAIDATGLATGLLGDTIATNMFLLGYAYQRGVVPVSAAAIERAIELNGAAVKLNLAAFQWGRRAVVDAEAVARAARPPMATLPHRALAPSIDEVIERRVAFLTAYQDRAYADRFATRVARVRAAEAAVRPGGTALTDAVARGLFKLMAIKDEYEVARLYTDPAFEAQLKAEFDGYDKLEVHLAPPILSGDGEGDGRPRKRAFGPWIFTAFKWLAAWRGRRGGWLDPFGHTQERRTERRVLAQYEALVDEIATSVTDANLAAAVALAATAQLYRGYGPVKAANLVKMEGEREVALAAFRAAKPLALAAE
jgi:indolepyruvate ferredoxin oxidoreductase